MASTTDPNNQEEEDLSPPTKRARTEDGLDASSGNKDGQETQFGSSTGGQPEIDESLYSRQLYVLGRDAMVRMAQSDVLICGMGGLGVEIAKNIILGGVKSVTLHDQALCTLDDLSSQYYLSEASLRQNRAKASEAPLAQLNEYVRVSAHTEPLTEQFVKQFSVLVLTQTPLAVQEDLAEFAHRNNIAVIVADTRGLAGQIFCDFGDNFRVLDTNGEPPQSVLIASITKDKKGVVTCLEDMRHEFENGDFVTFSEVKGMTEINGSPPRKIKVLSPHSFSVGDTTQFGEYVMGGVATQVKIAKDIRFKSFKQSITEPEFVISDFAKMDRPAQLHLGFLALHAFRELHSRLPYPWNKEDAAQVARLAKQKNASMATPVKEVDEKLIALLSCVSAGSLCPMQAVIGSIAAQEVMKACSGKFTPIRQWLYFDAFECLPTSGEVSEEEARELQMSRYAAQARVFGSGVQQELASQTIFVVGAGAIGCELLKNFAMMGVATDGGCIHVTDMDVIERSNLNRQFLFRPNDVGLMKSITAAKAVTKMNREISIEAHEDRVGPETENVYNDDFFEALDGVANALDNLDSRQYMDRKCVHYCKPLLESGTTGTKGNVQVVVPHMTESYSSSHDPPEKSIPVCTIKHFPNKIEHTLEWARDEFEGLFKHSAENAVQYLKDNGYKMRILAQPRNQADFLKTAGRQRISGISGLVVDNDACAVGALFFDFDDFGCAAMQLELVVALEGVLQILKNERCVVFDDCVDWARLRFEEQFNTQIQQLLRTYPPDRVTESGAPFWSGHKRCPRPIQFDPNNTLHMDYIVAAANLRAAMFCIPPCVDRAAIATILEEVDVPEPDLQPKAADPINDEQRLLELLNELPPQEQLKDIKLMTLEFDKDDDTNFHMDFITAASNLRATNYDIAPADRLQSKLIAGKIIPAIATTTSLVAGLACLELYKLVQGHNKLELFKNGFVNLALPFFGFSEPIAPAKKKYGDTEYTLWDCLEIQGQNAEGEMTLREFLDYFKERHGVEIYMLSEGVVLLYANYLPPTYYADRFRMPMSKVMETVSKKSIPAHKRALSFQLMCMNEKGEDVELPNVRYVLPR